MTSVLHLLRNILPLIAIHFDSLHFLAILRCTCKEIYQDTTNFTLLYRIVLQNVGWMNKTAGKQAFILNHQDIREWTMSIHFPSHMRKRLLQGFQGVIWLRVEISLKNLLQDMDPSKAFAMHTSKDKKEEQKFTKQNFWHNHRWYDSLFRL